MHFPTNLSYPSNLQLLKKLLLLGTLTLGIVACEGLSGGEADRSPPGSERGPCLDNETCDDGLDCLNELCTINNPDLCLDETCSGRGDCVTNAGVAECSCNAGYHAVGLTCVADDAPCASPTCSGQGDCSVETGACICNVGYAGADCSSCDTGFVSGGLDCVPSSCVDVDCSSHGTCDDTTTLCVCDMGYTGANCESCTAGYTRDGLDCVAKTKIIFETNFANDATFSHTGPTQFPWSNIGSIHPEGFDGTLIEGEGRIYGVEGEGMGTDNSDGGSVALKFEWANSSQPVTQLFKHLTGDATTGFEEIYIRYNIRLTNAITIGDASYSDDLPYWKWGRLWQNTSTYPGGVGDPDSGAGNWSENRQNAYYVVWNFGGTATWGFYNKCVYGANDLNGIDLTSGSAGSGRYGTDFYDGSGSRQIYAGVKGAFGNVGNGAWDFDVTTRRLLDTQQTYHTLEWRFKLASSQTSGDGVFQSWFDGVEQTPPTSISQGKLGAYTYDPPLDPSAIPTSSNSEVNASYNTGSGWNFFVLFDNMAFINRTWPAAGDGNGLWVNDIVISTERIGHDYIARPFTP